MGSNINRISTPDLREWFRRRVNEIKGELNVCLLGTIEKFYEAEQTADVKVTFKKVLKTDIQQESGNAQDRIIDYPLLVRVPVVVLNGGGGYISFPIEQGDECMVIFCDKDIDAWFSSGIPLPPNSERMHDISDGIAIVGPLSQKNSIASYFTNGIKICLGSALITIDKTGNIIITGTTITANGTAITLNGGTVNINPL